MNIEKILSKSASKFRETVRSVTPLIILYTILSYIFTPSILRDLQIEQNLDNLMSEMKNHDIFSSLLLVLTFSFFTIFINQFIITNIKKQIFKISDSISALTYMLVMFILLFLLFLFLVIIIPIPDLVILFILILYVYTFFGFYIKIDTQKSNLECLLSSYILCLNNLKNIFKLILFHILAIIIITYSIVILGLFTSQIAGSYSIILINILFYIASYFLSIVWIYAYFDFKQK